MSNYLPVIARRGDPLRAAGIDRRWVASARLRPARTEPLPRGCGRPAV